MRESRRDETRRGVNPSWALAWVAVVALGAAGMAAGCDKSKPADGGTAAVDKAGAAPKADKADAPKAAKAGAEEAAKADAPKASDKVSGKAPAKAPAKAAGEAPDKVAARYLRLGAAGDLSKLKGLVDPGCYEDPVGDVAAVKMLGVRMKLEEVTTKLVSRKGAAVRVAVTLKGSVDAKEAKTETSILGKPVTLKAAGLSMKGISKSQVLDLAKLDGRWVVTCHAAMSARASAKKKAAEEAKTTAKDDAKGGGAGADKGAEPPAKAEKAASEAK